MLLSLLPDVRKLATLLRRLRAGHLLVIGLQRIVMGFEEATDHGSTDALFSQSDFLEKTAYPEKPSCPFVLPDGQIILPGIVIPEERSARRAYSDHMARTAFVNMIPEEVRLELLRYSNRKWHLMSILARCPGAMDLSRSNPALLFALASNWAFHRPSVKQPIRAARGLV